MVDFSCKVAALFGALGETRPTLAVRRARRDAPYRCWPVRTAPRQGPTAGSGDI